MNKLTFWQRAKEIINKDDDSILQYACLELRFCLESITYQKLKLYSKRLPTSIIEKWQPPQAVRALLEIEPHADQDFSLRFCSESSLGMPDGNWTSLGNHKSLKSKWLNKNYNKLGSCLHISAPSKETSKNTDFIKLRAYLNEVVNFLEPIVNCSLDTSLAQVVTFDCGVCNQPIIANQEGLINIDKVSCLNPNCRAEYWVNSEGDKFNFQLIVSTFTCYSCDSKIDIENKKIKIGFEFSCVCCKAKHVIVSRQWGVAPKNSEK
jgi:hypothetical protein